MVKDLPSISHSKQVCEGCILRKQHIDPFPNGKFVRAKEPLELVHRILCEMGHPSTGGSKSFNIFIDDYSRKLWVYFLKEISDAFNVLC